MSESSFIDPHPEIDSCYHWYIVTVTEPWIHFNSHVDQLVEIAEKAEKPFVVIFTAQTDIPSGNPIPHLRRLIKVINQYDVFAGFLMCLPEDMSLARNFMTFVGNLSSWGDKVSFPYSYEDAENKARELLATHIS